MGTYRVLDLVPKGRDEEDLDFSMAWVRYHDRYETNVFEDADKPYWPETTGAGCCGARSRRGSAIASRRVFARP